MNHFFDLVVVPTHAIPSFWYITGFILISICIAAMRQITKDHRVLWRDGLPLAFLLPAPIILLWIGARWIHFDYTADPHDSDLGDAPSWPNYLLLGVICLFLILSLYAFLRFESMKLDSGRALFIRVLGLAVWLIFCSSFVAHLALCGDYYRWIYEPA
ncbi:MAG: hypothetical protein L3J39_04625 [Verrucomicrobiales bacterium]|nr:hypothetical protein [Verrucomicrobiales bacterium]